MTAARLDQPSETPSHKKTEDWHTQAASDAWTPKDLSSSGPAMAKTDWTVAYYLGAEKPAPGKPFDRLSDTGAPDKAARLKEMAAETKGKPVCAYVDVLREKDESFKARQAKDQREPSGNPSDYMVDHYRLRDGKVEKLDSTQSEGLTEDIKHLVHDASETKSKKLALVINGDGGGNRGLKSDGSPLTSNDDVSQAIKEGLRGSGHTKLDLLNFDQCLMSQTGALDKYKGVSKDIVASSETELVSAGRVDGQDLGKQLHNLLGSPTMTGRQWGDQIVSGADKGDNDRSGADPTKPNFTDSGTPTLANIDPARLASLTRAVDDLGKQLKTTVADPSNKAEVDRIITGLPRLGVDGAASGNTIYQKRDLKSFATELQKSLDKGTLSDPTGSLRDSLSQVRKAEAAAVTSYHGYADKDKDYKSQGGASIYLPDLDFRDIDRTMGHKTKLADAAEILDHEAKFAKDPVIGQIDPTKKAFADGALHNIILTDGDREFSPEEKKLAKPLTDALDKLRSDTTAEERTRDLETASRIAHDLLQSPLQKRLVQSLDKTVGSRSQVQSRDLELSADPRGWRDFVMSMGWTS